MVSVSSFEDHPEYVQLEAFGKVPGLEGAVRRREVSDRWARMLRAVAGQATGALFGHLCDDAVDGTTALDQSLPRGGPAGWPSCRTAIRSARGRGSCGTPPWAP